MFPTFYFTILMFLFPSKDPVTDICLKAVMLSIVVVRIISSVLLYMYPYRQPLFFFSKKIWVDFPAFI